MTPEAEERRRKYLEAEKAEYAMRERKYKELQDLGLIRKPRDFTKLKDLLKGASRNRQMAKNTFKVGLDRAKTAVKDTGLKDVGALLKKLTPVIIYKAMDASTGRKTLDDKKKRTLELLKRKKYK